MSPQRKTGKMIRLVIVDDEPMVLTHLRTVLESAGDITVVAQAQDGAEAVEAASLHQPDVMLMDLRMPGVDGLTAMEKIAKMPKPPAMVALTTFDEDTYVVRALWAGASGFLLKTTPAEDLIGLVRVAAEGHTVLSPEATRRLVAASAGEHQRTDRARRRTADLTEREVDMLMCLGEGLSNAAIADRLHLSEATVKSYVSRMLSKLGCANRTQAGLLAYEAGLVG
jgi:DNA-binding NarL/FixJ family response regulator